MSSEVETPSAVGNSVSEIKTKVAEAKEETNPVDKEAAEMETEVKAEDPKTPKQATKRKATSVAAEMTSPKAKREATVKAVEKEENMDEAVANEGLEKGVRK